MKISKCPPCGKRKKSIALVFQIQLVRRREDDKIDPRNRCDFENYSTK